VSEQERTLVDEQVESRDGVAEPDVMTSGMPDHLRSTSPQWHPFLRAVIERARAVRASIERET
jgi:hypothetical protein